MESKSIDGIPAKGHINRGLMVEIFVVFIKKNLKNTTIAKGLACFA